MKQTRSESMQRRTQAITWQQQSNKKPKNSYSQENTDKIPSGCKQVNQTKHWKQIKNQSKPTEKRKRRIQNHLSSTESIETAKKTQET